MKSPSKGAVALAVVALVVFARWGAWAGPAPGTGIEGGGHHDFTTLATNLSNRSDPTAQVTIGVCVRCHTPHKAISTTLLWNHTLSQNTFQWDQAKTTAGTNFPTFKGDTYQGSTAKCLSCHDGSVSTSDINWFNGATPTYTGTLPTPNNGSSIRVGLNGHMGAQDGSYATHPVAMPYPYGGVANTYNGVTTGGAIHLDEFLSTPAAPVRLYNDDGSGAITRGAVAAKSGIECQSCHDVHNRETVQDPLLRGTLSGNDTNYLCLKCHIK